MSSEFCISLVFTYDISDCIMAVFVFYGYWGRARYKIFASDCIMAVFVFYGYWGRARCKIFASATYRRLVMVVFVLPIRSKTVLVLAIVLCQVIFVAERGRSLCVALKRVEISPPVCDLMLNGPPEDRLSSSKIWRRIT